MEISRKWRFSCLLLGLFFLATTLQGVQGEVESEGPSESECRPFIEKALKELETAETEHVDPGAPSDGDSKEDALDVEGTTDDSAHDVSVGEDDTENGDNIESSETQPEEDTAKDSEEQADEPTSEQDEKSAEEPAEVDETTESQEKPEDAVSGDEESTEVKDASQSAEEAADEPQAESQETESIEEPEADTQESHETESEHDTQPETDEDTKSAESGANEDEEHTVASEEVESEAHVESEEKQEEQEQSQEEAKSEEDETKSQEEESQDENTKSQEDATSHEDDKSEDQETKSQEVDEKSQEAQSQEEEQTQSHEDSVESQGQAESQEEVDAVPEESTEQKDDEKSAEEDEAKSVEQDDVKSAEEEAQPETDASTEAADESAEKTGDTSASTEDVVESTEQPQSAESTETAESIEKVDVSNVGSPETKESAEDIAELKSGESEKEAGEDIQGDEGVPTSEETHEESAEGESEEPKEEVPEEDLTLEIDIPDNLRPRDHIDQLLKLDDSNAESEAILNRISDITLRELKRLYESAIKPLETLYKYRDLSNRHFGDSEIFSKPLVLFMGPWSGGKSSIINYLVDNEYNTTSLRTGAEPSPAYFNILMHGDEPEVLDGTQLAADFTFAGLQKFGQGLEERLRGLKLPSTLLEKINIVEIPGILEVRKQVSRVFPFNDACQWFIDRADIIFLVYDPSKLDVGPETEAILDQLKGREHQTRIVLNKADQVKPEELMRVQGALIWNISPLMSSAQPPVMYTTSLWSRPYETWAPIRLLQAQERAFLRDLRSAVDKRIENKISSARRFAVRVRNHAKMVDCYLTTYYNHKSVFGNRKQVSDQIIEHPQDYHIYEGLSTLTNISRYDLPDPDVYRDFFRLNPLYDFQQLSATCTYFRGCPINRLDVAIAYDLPEMGGKHKKLVESALTEKKTES